MLYLLGLGLALWSVGHFWKRIAPQQRARLQDKMGDASKGVVAGALLISVVMMVIGYRGSDFIAVYDPPSWGRHLNNLLMLVAVVLLGLGNSKSRLRRFMRHPMLAGTALWGGAHLLVRGDLASIILFGGIVIWALIEMVLINARGPAWAAPDNGSLAGDIRLGLISALVFAVIAFIHNWLGYWPFGG